MTTFSIENINQFVGQKIGTSAWFQVDQARVNQFADVTQDHQWIHVDKAKAEASPLGSTIVHGFLTLSLLPMWSDEVGAAPSGILQAFNYGSDKVRFLSPVKVGSRLRDHIELQGVEEKGNGRLLLRTRHTVEIEGEERPAMVADTLTMIFTP